MVKQTHAVSRTFQVESDQLRQSHGAAPDLTWDEHGETLKRSSRWGRLLATGRRLLRPLSRRSH